MDIVQIARDTGAILTCLVLIGGIVYWTIKSKLKEDFCEKKECLRKHEKLDTDLMVYRNGITDDIKEIKEMVKEIRGWVFDFLKKG